MNNFLKNLQQGLHKNYNATTTLTGTIALAIALTLVPYEPQELDKLVLGQIVTVCFLAAWGEKSEVQDLYTTIACIILCVVLYVNLKINYILWSLGVFSLGWGCNQETLKVFSKYLK